MCALSGIASLVVRNFESPWPRRFWELPQAHEADRAACLQAGARARLYGLAHGDNPHMNSLLFLLPVVTTAEVMQLDRVEAWWDGWEEADQRIKPHANR